MLKKTMSFIAAAAMFLSIVPVTFAEGIVINSFTITPELGGTTFDPSPSGNQENITFAYTVTGDIDNVTTEIRDQYDTVMKSYTSVNNTDTHVWDGIYNTKLLLPGVYTTKLTAFKAGSAPVVETKNFVVQYDNTGKGALQNVSVNPSSFDPDSGNTTFSFTNTESTNITVMVRELDGDIVTQSVNSSYDDDSYSASHTHNVLWEGVDSAGNKVVTGTYKLIAIARNDYGVVVAEQAIQIVDTATSIDSSNAHISGLKFSPSSTFEPVDDEELDVEFDVKVDIDSLTVYAIRGSKKIEIFQEDNMDKDENYTFYWDGVDDDDEYVEEGSWKIQFESKLGSTTLLAEKSINVKYLKPQIDDILVSKKKFDNDRSEFTNVMFRVDEDAVVTVNILQDNEVQDSIVEDMDVEKDLWYAVEWDGDRYDYGDNLDFQVIAENVVNENIYDVDTIAIDLAEDDVSSSRSNVTEDYISPVITDGQEEMTIFYDLEDDADIEVAIHRGESGSGSDIIVLLNESNHAAGGHSVTWNGLDKNGNVLKDGIYSYSIKSRLRSTDEEVGAFIIGEVGDIDGSASGSGSSSNSGSNNNNNSGVAPGVIVDGVVIGGNNNSNSNSGSSSACGGFSDVNSNSKYCAAIKFVKERGIFDGYSDGRFGPFDSINRAEILKVILEAMNISASSGVTGNLGFSDVQAGAWYMPYVSVARGFGIFQGDAGKSTARPNAFVNRAEALKLVFETLRVTQGYEAQTCSYSYPDVPNVIWFAKYACESSKYNLLDAFGGINLGPGSYTTRGEMAELFYRLSQAGVI